MENKNGQGIFLGVIGVATLVVAIIGATFAFFSASATSEAGDIAGQTLGTQGGVLSITVDQVWDAPTQAASIDLVPTNLDVSSNLQAAMTAKCEATSGVNSDTTKYTGCHVYRITVTSGSDLAGVDLNLNSLTTTNTDTPTEWKYAFFTATEATAGTLTSAAQISGKNGQFQVSSPVNVYTGETLNEANSHTKVVYLVVYVHNENYAQNTGTNQTNNVLGSYTGTVEAATTGGSTVQATFTAS